MRVLFVEKQIDYEQLGLLYLTDNGVTMDCHTAEHWFSSVNEKSDIYP